MNKRTLPLLAVLVLCFAAPLTAQTQPAPVETPPQQTPVEEPANQIPDEFAETESDAIDDSGELPRTAGPLPLIALLGIASGASALVLRRHRR